MKILIIDDEILIRQALSHVSNLKGHDTRMGASGEEGLLKWKSLQPDLVFLDLILPDQDGFSVIQQAPSSAHIVMMSAYGQYKEKAIKSGAHLFLVKPFENIFQTFDYAIDSYSLKEELIGLKTTL